MSIRQRVVVCLLAATGVAAALGRLPVTTPDLGPLSAGAAAQGGSDAQPSAPADPRPTRPVVVGTPQLARVVDERGAGAGEIPYPALRAYLRAAQVLADARPKCRLGWPLLAAVGRVESDHGRAGDTRLHPDGVSTPAIIGPALDGRGRVAPVPDSDGGRLDGDRTWDRAVGPMQIVPGTWTLIGVDGDGDGVRSPGDIDDAALAVGVHLCSAGVALDSRVGMRAALHRYNAAPSYAGLVLSYERLYRATEDAAAATVAPAPLAAPVVQQAQARTARLARHPDAVARASNTHPVLASAHPQPRPAETTARPSEPTTGTTSAPSTGPTTGPTSLPPSAPVQNGDPSPAEPGPTTGATDPSTAGAGGETASGDPTTADPTPDPTPGSTAPTSEAPACTVDGSASTDPAPGTTDPAPSTTTDPCPVQSSPSDPAVTAGSAPATGGDAQDPVSPSSPAAP